MSAKKTKKNEPSKSQKVLKWVTDHPDWGENYSKQGIATLLNVKPQDVYDALRRQKQGIARVEVSHEGKITKRPGGGYRQSFHRMFTEVPITIKLISGNSTNPNRILGTLEISATGLKWFKSNSKKAPDRELSFKMLEKFMSLGLV